MIYDPHSQFGLHDTEKGQVICLWRPGAEWISLEVQGQIVSAVREEEAGFFRFPPSERISPTDYRIYHRNGLLAHDPYSFSPTIEEADCQLFSKGFHYELYNLRGAQIGTFHGIKGVRFAMWAPNADSVYLVGDFNNWDGRINPMRSTGVSGIWELFVP